MIKDGVWSTFLTLVLSILFLTSVVTAESPRTVNVQIYLDVLSLLRHIPGKTEIALRNLADRLEKEVSLSATPFCEVEFEPISMEDVYELPKEGRTIEKVVDRLGTPCKEDSGKIYYLTRNNGKVIWFDKATGKGGFQS